jgi:folylpolyglutamate synthase/dihydropteroate synthase
MLRLLGELAPVLVATQSSSPRALSAVELAGLARPHFATVEAVESPPRALARAHELGEPVLVTGSLYLLADLAARRPAGVP